MNKVHNWRRALTRGVFVGVVVTTLVWTSVPARAAPADNKVLSAPAIAQRDQPAVQLIETDVVGSLTYYKLNVNTDTIVKFAQDNADIQGAGNAGNFGDVTRLIVGELTARPDSYLGKGAAVNVNDELVYDGSGFNITPDGYIVTNTHVAVVSKEVATQGFVNDTLGAATDNLTSALTAQLGAITFGGHALAIPADQQPAVKALILKFIGATAQVGNITTTVYAGGGPTLSRNLVHKGQVARVVASGAVFPGKDVAILKIEARNLPVLTMGDDSAVQTGDGVHSLGYPGDATFDPSQVADTVTADSTMADGTVSNRLQSSAANFQIIENTATINHGSSGGPLVNDRGQVVGITTALDASTEQKNGVNGGKFFLAVPSSVISDLLATNRVVPSTSPDQLLYNKALELMGQSHYKAALQALRQAQADGYNTPYLQLRLDSANKAVASGQDKATSKSSPVMPIAAGFAALVIILLIVLVLVRRRRAKPGTTAGGSVNVAGPFATAGSGETPGSRGTWTGEQAPLQSWEPPSPPFAGPLPPAAAPQPFPVWQGQPPQVWPEPRAPQLQQWPAQAPATQPGSSPQPAATNGRVEPDTAAAGVDTVLVAPPAGVPTNPQAQPIGPPAPTGVGPALHMVAGWYIDPIGRHQLRYWDAMTWTQHVSDNGVVSIEPT